MKKSGLLNPQLCAAVARLGHTQTFVVADAGLPIPHEVPVIDLAVVLGTPRFQEVFDAIPVSYTHLTLPTNREV